MYQGYQLSLFPERSVLYFFFIKPEKNLYILLSWNLCFFIAQIKRTFYIIFDVQLDDLYTNH